MADMKMLEPTDRGLSAGYMMWYRFSRNPAAVIGSLILLSVLVLAVFAPWLTPYPKHIGAVVDFRARHMPPDLEHWFGTDKAGRDIFSRTIFGLRVSLLLVIGVLGGYLLYAQLVESGPHAISIMEKLTGRSLGSAGREIIAVTLDEKLSR